LVSSAHHDVPLRTTPRGYKDGYMSTWREAISRST